MKKKIIFGLLSFIPFISLWVCSSNNQQSIEKSTLNVPRTIPNSTAHVSCRFLELREENDIIYGIIEIDTVLGYGASTPPLSPNSKVKIQIPDKYVERVELSETESKNVRIEILKQQTGMGMTDNKVWYLNRFIK